jgi:hypothetical protein
MGTAMRMAGDGVRPCEWLEMGYGHANEKKSPFFCGFTIAPKKEDPSEKKRGRNWMDLYRLKMDDRLVLVTPLLRLRQQQQHCYSCEQKLLFVFFFGCCRLGQRRDKKQGVHQQEKSIF